MPERTPLPWQRSTEHDLHGKRGEIIRGPQMQEICRLLRIAGMDRRDANAEFIVRACNSFDDLLAALEEVMKSPRLREGLTASQFAQVWECQLAALKKASKP